MSSFGGNLKRERELRGVSLQEIAEATKISLRFLQALEEDRLGVLPGGLFPRSFVRQYARHLGLDAEKLVAEFLYQHGEALPEPKPALTYRPRWTPPPAAVFLGALVVAAAALFVHQGTFGSADPKPRPAAPAPASAVLPTDRVYPPPPADGAPNVSAAPQGLVLAITARQSCWVQVRIDGQTALDRVLSEGESQTLEAEGEIVLSVGNAGGVTFSLNDRQGVPLGKSGEVRKNIVITKQSLPSLVQDAPAVRAERSS
jgi:cytoskeletal protein RodZ